MASIETKATRHGADPRQESRQGKRRRKKLRPSRSAVRVTSTAALRKPGGSVNTPSDEKMESTSKPANLMPSPAATP
jgi:hypothetical protein